MKRYVSPAKENSRQEAKEKSIDAHDVQTKLITGEINGDKTETSLLMVHAQDHLMTSILARDLIEEMIGMLKEQSEAKALQ